MYKIVSLIPALGFAAFVLWLLAVPMNGPLVLGIGIDNSLQWFLLPHIVALTVIGRFCSHRLFSRLAPVAIILTLVLSLLLPLAPAFGKVLLVLLSLTGAFVAIGACKHLHHSHNALASAAGGLILANLILFVVFHFSSADFFSFAFSTLPLVLLLVPAGKEQNTPIVTTAKLRHYLPFILIFHVVSGLMYSVIYPAYQTLSMPGGVELPFYMATVIGAVFLVRINRETPLISGVVLGMGAFILLQWNQAAAIPLSLFVMQAAQGFIDLFLLAFLLRFADPLRAFGIGLATLCLGIYGGHILGDLLVGNALSVALFGLVFLNLAVLTLYLLNRRRATTPNANSPLNEIAQIPSDQEVTTTSSATSAIPEQLRPLLSEREYLVLAQSLDGATYKQIAADLDISESTVKTYMKRICDKLGVSGKKKLFQYLSLQEQHPSD